MSDIKMGRDEFRRKFCQLNYLDRYRIVFGESPGDLRNLVMDMFDEAGDDDERDDLINAVEEALTNPSIL